MTFGALEEPYSSGLGKPTFAEGIVQNTSLVPAEKLTAASLLELDTIYVLVSVVPAESSVPKPLQIQQNQVS